jgi:hypothetical protein
MRGAAVNPQLANCATRSSRQFAIAPSNALESRDLR